MSGTHGLQMSGVGNWLYLADWHRGGTKRLISSHLACFHAGNFIFVSISMHSLFPRETDRPLNKGRKVTKEPNHRRVRLGIERRVLEYLWKFAVSFTFYSHAGGALTGVSTGIGPEVFAWKTGDGKFSGPAPTVNQEVYYKVIQTCDVLCCIQQLKLPSDTRILPIRRRLLLLPQTRNSRIQLLRLASDWRLEVSVPCR